MINKKFPIGNESDQSGFLYTVFRCKIVFKLLRAKGENNFHLCSEEVDFTAFLIWSKVMSTIYQEAEFKWVYTGGVHTIIWLVLLRCYWLVHL